MKNLKTIRTGLGFGFVGLLAASASAQTYTEILREGNTFGSGTEVISRIDNVDINGSGDWLVELDSDGASDMDHYMLSNGTIIWQQGQTMGFPAPAGFVGGGFIDTMDINDNGDIMFITAMAPVGTTSTRGYMLVRNGMELLTAWNSSSSNTGTVAPASLGLPVGTYFTGVSEAWQNNNGQLLIGGSVALGGTGSTPILVRADLDMAGNIATMTKVAMRGETLPGASHVTPIQGFSFSKGRQAINDSGDYIWYVDDDHTIAPGSVDTDANIYINSTQMHNEADAWPTDPAEVWNHMSAFEFDINNNGDYLVNGDDDGDTLNDYWLIKNVGGVWETIAHEGDPVPAIIPGPWVIRGFGFGGIVPMSNTGDVLWYMDWDDTDTTIDTALWYNDDLLLREGISVLGGIILEDVPNGDTEIAMSDDGSMAIMEVVLDDTNGAAMTDLDAVYLVELQQTAGTPYCDPAVVNSTTFPGVLKAIGSDVAMDNNLVMEASDLPVGEFGYLLNGLGNNVTMNPGNSAGNLCVSGQIGRYNTVADIFQTGPNGTGTITLDLTNTPTNMAPTSVVAGQTWYFQVWYRDTTGMTSNFTNGVEILFQ